MADTHKNFAYSTVATAPSPASSGTSLVVAAGEGARFPAVPFNATVWPASVAPIPTNAEIVRVTSIATDTLTITRTQEGGGNRSILVGDQIAATITAKTLTDVEQAASTADSKGVSSATAGSTADSKALSVSTNTSEADSKGDSASQRASTADSKGVSGASVGSVADSKSLSVSLNTSTADSKGTSGATRASVADSKSVSCSANTSTVLSRCVSRAGC